MDNKIPTPYLRLRPNHPVMQKLEEVFALMEKLGILFVGNEIIVVDCETNTDYHIVDIESQDPLDSVPPVFEYKVTHENPKYKEYCDEEQRKRKEEKQKQEEEKANKLKLEEEKKKQEAEQREIELCQELMKKHKL